MTRDEVLAIIEEAKEEKIMALGFPETLNALPKEIGQLHSLMDIHLDHTQLSALPKEIGQLRSLISLYVDNTQLSVLPQEIGRLRSLTALTLDNTQLSVLPQEIGLLQSLIRFTLHNTQMSALPNEIGALTQLQLLDLVNSGVTELPLSIRHLDAIHSAAVVINNQPDEHERWDTSGLYVDDTIRFPPPEVVEIGIDAVRNYLSADAYHEIWASKCVVVGEGGVGKTSLIHALKGQLADGSEVGTVGIDILPLELPHPEKAEITMQLNCWDFAGQDFNHAMHQFFFGNRSLILLVWNARHGWQQGKLNRWLENIKVRAPQASVILVATHTDQPHSDYPKADLQNNYPQIVATMEVSSSTGHNIEMLRALIQKHAVTLPLMGLKWPATWLAAANAVRELRGNHHDTALHYTTRSHVYAVMSQQGLDEKQCAILMRWLHELGDILNFSDEPAIADYVILDPEWLTQDLGLVLRSDEVQERNGILTRNHLLGLWPDLDEQIRVLFLHVMDKFDLAYLIPDDPEDRSLIVERLPLDPPNYQLQWDEFAQQGREITLRFKLGSMQPGIPSWFIARCHRFTMNVHWLNGVLFQDEEDHHRALIIADDQRKQVEMRVRGPFPQRFMALLRDGFRDTLKRYRGLEVERWIPCTGTDRRRKAACSAEFDLSILEEILMDPEEEDKTIQCYICRTQHDLYHLVEGIGSGELAQPLTEQRIEKIFQENLEQQTRTLANHFDQKALDLARFFERNFLRAFLLEQQRELITCPNLFTIYRVSMSQGLLRKHQWRIQLYSQKPGQWRPAGDPYLIDEMHEWYKKAMPYLKTLHQVLKVAPLVGTLLGVAEAGATVIGETSQQVQDLYTTFENEIALMGELLTLPDLLSDEIADEVDDMMGRSQRCSSLALQGRERPTSAIGGSFRKFEGAELVIIRELMDKLAEMDQQAGRPKWGGLTRRQTPEGDILWLDQEQLQEYLSKRPMPSSVI